MGRTVLSALRFSNSSILAVHFRDGLGLYALKHVFSPPQRRLNMLAYVLPANDVFELCLLHQLRRLRSRAAQNQSTLAGVQLLCDLLESK